MRKLLAIIACVGFLAIAGPCWGQREEEASYNSAKKITYGIYPEPTYQVSRERTVDPDTQAVGSKGYIGRWNFEVVQILDKKNSLLSLGGNIYWLEDYPTESLADGDVVRVVDPVIFQGSKQYKSVGGAGKTVRSFKLVPKEAQQAEREPLFRVYELKDGKNVKVEFFGYQKKELTYYMKDVNGESVRLKLNQLQNADDKAHLKKLGDKYWSDLQKEIKQRQQ